MIPDLVFPLPPFTLTDWQESRYVRDMNSRSDELDAMKRIDLCQYAASRGFVLDRRQSSRHSAVMRHANGDKLIVARSKSGHYVYFNAKGSDNGSIIDLIQARDRVSLGEVRKLLRPWLSGGSIARSELPVLPMELQPSEHDAARVLGAWMKARPIGQTHEYLEKERGIPREILTHPKFHNRIRIDDRGNAVFPHFNQSGLCGFELKNRGFTGFSPGGVKGLACSRPEEGDRDMVICETTIDMLSLAALEGTEGRRFFSTAGQISPLQAECLRSAVAQMPENGTIILAFDCDDGGQELSRRVSESISGITQQIVAHSPNKVGLDWNDVLMAASSPIGSSTTMSSQASLP